MKWGNAREVVFYCIVFNMYLGNVRDYRNVLDVIYIIRYVWYLFFFECSWVNWF